MEFFDFFGAPGIAGRLGSRFSVSIFSIIHLVYTLVVFGYGSIEGDFLNYCTLYLGFCGLSSASDGLIDCRGVHPYNYAGTYLWYRIV